MGLPPPSMSSAHPREQRSPTTPQPGHKSPDQPHSRWRRPLSRLFGRDDTSASPAPSTQPATSPAALSDDAGVTSGAIEPQPRPAATPRPARQVIPGTPRQTTFQRQLSERRERLFPSDIPLSERRTLSVDRRRALFHRPSSPSAATNPIRLTPAFGISHNDAPIMRPHSTPTLPQQTLPHQATIDALLRQRPANPPTPPPDEPTHVAEGSFHRGSIANDIQVELESKWILNLSMHFRDKSPREKFFVTYAETATRWRRVTVSCDYRNAPPESLEADLHALNYQRDKSSRIYEAIRTSLADIQFYETVTNLRLETSPDDRLHVHVTEDVNEIIPYPDKHLLGHLDPVAVPRISVKNVHFISHMSGFVYKVRVGNETLIKKEIPGPDSVEEFLYEINALSSLVGRENVVQIRGLVIDDDSGTITGLLIDYYEQGPLVDMLFDYRGELSWKRRAKWARQIISGLADIHEAGFVQGDFTVSNICIGSDDNARIIDINRRGCPVGWEPPEIAPLIESGQRISMYIGVKSDVFQLGMVLWAIAMEDDEPERRKRPLQLLDDETNESNAAPSWYRRITRLCLEPVPAKRPSAHKLLEDGALTQSPALSTQATEGQLAEATHTWTSATTAVPTISLSHFDQRKGRSVSSVSSVDDLPRGRSPPRNTAHLKTNWYRDHPGRSSHDSSFREGGSSSVSPAPHQGADDEDEVEPEIVAIDPTSEGWREITVNGRGYIVREDRLDGPPEQDSREHDTNTDTGFRGRHVEVGEDAFGRHSLYPSVPPAPEVPRAPDPPSIAHSFQQMDSSLADMDTSDQSRDHSGYYAPANQASGHGTECSGSDYGFRFAHHDSGIADMDFEHELEAHLRPHPEVQHGHRSGRRTWGWNKPQSSRDEESEVVAANQPASSGGWQSLTHPDGGAGKHDDKGKGSLLTEAVGEGSFHAGHGAPAPEKRLEHKQARTDLRGSSDFSSPAQVQEPAQGATASESLLSGRSIQDIEMGSGG